MMISARLFRLVFDQISRWRPTKVCGNSRSVLTSSKTSGGGNRSPLSRLTDFKPNAHRNVLKGVPGKRHVTRMGFEPTTFGTGVHCAGIPVRPRAALGQQCNRQDHCATRPAFTGPPAPKLKLCHLRTGTPLNFFPPFSFATTRPFKHQLPHSFLTPTNHCHRLRQNKATNIAQQ